MKSSKMDRAIWDTVVANLESVESSAVPEDLLLKAKRDLDVWQARQAVATERVRLSNELFSRDLAAGDADACGCDLASLLERVEAVRCSPFAVKEGMEEVGRLVVEAKEHAAKYAQRRADAGLPTPPTFPSVSFGGTILTALRSRLENPVTAEDMTDRINLASGEIRRIALARAQAAHERERSKIKAEKEARWQAAEHERRTLEHVEKSRAEYAARQKSKADEDALIGKYCPLH